MASSSEVAAALKGQSAEESPVGHHPPTEFQPDWLILAVARGLSY
jgi:hypothetical protein